MKIRFKSNNLIAIFIAVFLMITGIVLAVIHKQSKSDDANANVLALVAEIHGDPGGSTINAGVQSELDLIRESIDWSDA